jgi:hypothetical protein
MPSRAMGSDSGKLKLSPGKGWMGVGRALRGLAARRPSGQTILPAVQAKVPGRGKALD